MTETSRELSSALHFLERMESRRAPVPTPGGPWCPCTTVEKLRVADRGHDEPSLSAVIGSYEVFLCRGESWPDGEDCWTWVLEYSGQADSPAAMVETASGFVVGSEADAKARAETMAVMFGGMVET